MDEQLAAFLEFLQVNRAYSDNTTAAYRNDLGQFLRFLRRDHAGTSQWTDVTVAMVEAYVREMKRQSYASSSIARKVAAIKSFFHHLHATNVVSDDPTVRVESPKVEKRLPEPLSMEEVDNLLLAPTKGQSAKHLRDSALLALLYATGMRVTEVVSLNVDDIDLDEEQLRCLEKGGDYRILPFDAATHNRLARYLKEGRPQLAKSNEVEALFLNHRGQQLTRQGLWLIIKAYARQARLSTAVTPHTLRHSFASHKLNSGTKLKEVQQLLGHANISTTQVYTQLVPTDESEE